MNTKVCHACKTEKLVTEFSKNAKRADGLQSSCKICMKAYKSNHYQANSDKVKAASKARKQASADRLWEYKQGKSCKDCGYNNPLALEFDHLGDKLHDVGWMASQGFSWKAVLSEIAKCEIVCANCHRIRTATRAGWVRNITVRF